MATNVRNIIIGAARIYISKKDSTTADWTDAYQDGLDPFAASPQPTGSYVASTGTGGALDTAKWSEVGFTSDGLRVMYEPTFGEVEVDQQLDVAAVPDARLDLSIGALNAEPVERQFVAVGNAPGATVGGVAKDRERVYYARRVLSVEASEHALTRNEATRFPVTFRLLGDPRYSDTYGRIVDRIVA